MKKTVLSLAVAALLLTGCGGLGTTGTTTGTTTSASSGSVLGNVLGGVLSNAGTVGNVLSSVLGTNTLTTSQLYGTWKYNGPGVAFTSEKALARAGGEVAAAKVESELLPHYQKLGISSSNTWITFNQDGSYSAKIDGKSMSGTYTLDESTGAIKLQGLLLNLTGYVKRTSGGISLLFESKKILTLFQTVAAVSGNTTVSTIGTISKNYDGVRIGFEMKK